MGTALRCLLHTLSPIFHFPLLESNFVCAALPENYVSINSLPTSGLSLQ
jgi:hypothetical protein